MKNKKALTYNELIKFLIWIVFFIIVVSGIYLLFKKLGV